MIIHSLILRIIVKYLNNDFVNCNINFFDIIDGFILDKIWHEIISLIDE